MILKALIPKQLDIKFIEIKRSRTRRLKRSADASLGRRDRRRLTSR